MKCALRVPDVEVGANPETELAELRGTSGRDLSAAAERSMGSIDERKQRRAISRIDRADNMEGHFHLLLVVGLWIAGLAILGVAGSLIWNMSAPHEWRYLDAGEIDTLKTFLFSGSIGSALTAAGRKVAGGKSTDTDEAAD